MDGLFVNYSSFRFTVNRATPHVKQVIQDHLDGYEVDIDLDNGHIDLAFTSQDNSKASAHDAPVSAESLDDNHGINEAKIHKGVTTK